MRTYRRRSGGVLLNLEVVVSVAVQREHPPAWGASRESFAESGTVARLSIGGIPDCRLRRIVTLKDATTSERPTTR